MNDEQDEITIDHSDENLDDSVIADEHKGDTIKKLKEKLKDAESKKQEYLDGWQREKADFINIRKRDEEAKQEFLKYAKEETMLDIIPVLDSFDLAFRNKTAWEELPKDWRIGIESIYNQLISVLEAHGVKKVVPVGEVYDPKLHEAVESLPVSEKEKDGVVLEVLQAGYTLAGKEVRPAKVKVGHLENQ